MKGYNCFREEIYQQNLKEICQAYKMYNYECSVKESHTISIKVQERNDMQMTEEAQPVVYAHRLWRKENSLSIGELALLLSIFGIQKDDFRIYPAPHEALNLVVGWM